MGVVSRMGEKGNEERNEGERKRNAYTFIILNIIHTGWSWYFLLI